uniref:Uncharacterized protein n=1 Tax=Chromera velia CCMP2878 TaxID=1169474 RepID=A0A0G4F0W9_9ALVE|eukprot:Cvel_2616.t1-p1 / transcript=Cvel_2616.t1 / gene=Cvel_2616 / organism=Chromera_velia_CCMP2878 / gene_product=hypothetical protein / transcript_product=hypothetical protein / location=Cvel_scaffold103:116087-119603(-) / protein_length=277 / sequence_SO=supercontig / SO=protein_coding / is_pseudo=false
MSVFNFPSPRSDPGLETGEETPLALPAEKRKEAMQKGKGKGHPYHDLISDSDREFVLDFGRQAFFRVVGGSLLGGVSARLFARRVLGSARPGLWTLGGALLLPAFLWSHLMSSNAQRVVEVATRIQSASGVVKQDRQHHRGVGGSAYGLGQRQRSEEGAGEDSLIESEMKLNRLFQPVTAPGGSSSIPLGPGIPQGPGIGGLPSSPNSLSSLQAAAMGSRLQGPLASSSPAPYGGLGGLRGPLRTHHDARDENILGDCSSSLGTNKGAGSDQNPWSS